MGCDIHMFVETRRNKKSLWSKVGKVFKSDIYDRLGEYDLDIEQLTDEPYEGRNYHLFAFLAGVRNDDEIKPLSEPRGLPEDISDELKKESDEWDCDGHSHSHFTLKELTEVDWHFKTIPFSGMVDPKNYKLFKKTGRPASWCSWAGGPGSEKYKSIKWEESLAEGVGDFMDSIGCLRRYAEKNSLDYENIRIVFWFDN